MTQHRLLAALVATTALVGFALTCDAGDNNNSTSKVKATATAGKINGQGEQLVTITLKIEQGWHLYANPVNHNKEFLDAARTKVNLAAKAKLEGVRVLYPQGKTYVDKDTKDEYDIYTGVVKIEANLKRVAGDTSPLELVIDVQSCNGKVCLIPGKVKLTIP